MLSVLTRSATALVALIAVGACSSSGEAGSAITVVDSAVTIVDNDLQRLSATCVLDSTPTISIGTDSGPPEYQLHRVMGARRLSDGRIVLVNQGSQEIRFYDRAGKFLSRAGRAGQGPGEFQNAFQLKSMPGDSIWVGDYRPWEFEVFAPDGKWVRAVRPTPQYINSPSPMIVLSDGRSILGKEISVRGNGSFQPVRVAYFLHGPDGALLGKVGEYENGRRGQVSEDPMSVWLFPLFESFAHASGAGSRVVIGHGSEARLTIYAVGDTIRAERIIRWTVPDRTVSAEDAGAERRRLTDRNKQFTDPDTRRRLIDPLLSEARPVADLFPAFSGVTVGTDGRIWVREYSKPTIPDARRMVAFDADGRFVCRTTLPPFGELLEIGADYLLAENQDELGVERIVQYRLGAPRP